MERSWPERGCSVWFSYVSKFLATDEGLVIVGNSILGRGACGIDDVEIQTMLAGGGVDNGSDGLKLMAQS